MSEILGKEEPVVEMNSRFQDFKPVVEMNIWPFVFDETRSSAEKAH